MEPAKANKFKVSREKLWIKFIVALLDRANNKTFLFGSRSFWHTWVVLIWNNGESVARIWLLDSLCFSGMVEPKVVGFSQANHAT